MSKKTKTQKISKKDEAIARLTAAGAENIEVQKAPVGFTGFEASCSVLGHVCRAGGATKLDALLYLERAFVILKKAYGVSTAPAETPDSGPIGVVPAPMPSVGP